MNAGSWWDWQDDKKFDTLDEALQYVNDRPTGVRKTLYEM